MTDRNGQTVKVGDRIRCFTNGEQSGAIEKVEKGIMFRYRAISLRKWLRLTAHAQGEFEIFNEQDGEQSLV